jgi:hypothetical protein
MIIWIKNKLISRDIIGPLSSVMSQKKEIIISIVVETPKFAYSTLSVLCRTCTSFVVFLGSNRPDRV